MADQKPLIRDRFEVDKKFESVLSFPCCVCQYRHGTDRDYPCNVCEHNLFTVEDIGDP